MQPFITFPGKIHLIATDSALEAVAEPLTKVTELGFDTETRPSFKKGEVYKVALLQLATQDQAYLIRLHTITKFELLKQIFENQQVAKAGLAIRDDLKALQKVFDFSPQKFFELQDIAKTKGLKNFGLRGMVSEVLQKTLSKGPQTTNWEAPILTDRQLMYAATDAWVGLKLFKALTE